ncbi:subtilisin-like protease SBT4.3 [Tanacetum coccineum]
MEKIPSVENDPMQEKLKLIAQTRYVFILNGGVVDWKSTKQSIFATSSTDADYIAAFDASKEAPDVTAPGVEILAAFSPKAAPSGYPIDNRSVEYNILSGTSMATPHVTAAAAYVKSFHPGWSPSAIKSALMTTAWKFFDGLHPEAEFAYGSGHINALMATDPGLVYETPVEEYQSLTATNASFPSDREINYPSMAALVDKQSFVVSIPRTVTDLRITVEPSTLQFTALNENLSFVVTVRGKRMKPLTTRRASLVWTDGVHKVHSPLVLYRLNATSGGEKAIPSSVPVLIQIPRNVPLFFGNVKAKVKAAIYRVMPFDAGTLPVRYLVYWSSMFMLPKSVIYEMDEGSHGDLQKESAKVKWSDVCCHKSHGGLDWVMELRLLSGLIIGSSLVYYASLYLRDIYEAGFSLSCKVADVVENGEWKRPAICARKVITGNLVIGFWSGWLLEHDGLLVYMCQKPDITALGVNILAAWSPIAIEDTDNNSDAAMSATSSTPDIWMEILY